MTTQPAARIWGLEARRAGDHSQVLGLLERLNEPYIVKSVALRSLELLLAPPFMASRLALDPKRSSPLQPPWPDLVVASGREGEAVARWVRRQSQGQTRLVQLGRPWGNLSAYDLVITTPQYRLPKRANVLELPVPFHRVSPSALAAAAAAWQEELTTLPAPRLTVLLGGDSLPYRFSPHLAQQLAESVSQWAAATGGGLMISTSKRTPPKSLEAFRDHLKAPHFLFDVKTQGGDNPFFALLALSDAIIVTGDSVSMSAEAVASKKPVYLFDLGQGVTSMKRSELPPLWVKSDFWPTPQPSLLLYRLLQRFGPYRWSRHLALFHRRLVADGQAQWWEATAQLQRSTTPSDPLVEAVEQVKALLTSPAPKPARPSLAAL